MAAPRGGGKNLIDFRGIRAVDQYGIAVTGRRKGLGEAFGLQDGVAVRKMATGRSDQRLGAAGEEQAGVAGRFQAGRSGERDDRGERRRIRMGKRSDDQRNQRTAVMERDDRLLAGDMRKEGTEFRRGAGRDECPEDTGGVRRQALRGARPVQAENQRRIGRDGGEQFRIGGGRRFRPVRLFFGVQTADQRDNPDDHQREDGDGESDVLPVHTTT